MDNVVQILMATFNGGRYVSEQIDSILAQTYQRWELLVLDDASDDDTLLILRSYVDRYPNRIKIISCHLQNMGVVNTFADLLRAASASYVALCDQDDVWYPDKLQKMHATMKNAECIFPNIPLLVHSDLEIVNQDLELISPSLFEVKKVEKVNENSDDCLYWNVVTGAAMLINRRVLELVRHIPPRVPMHDMWIACRVVFAEGLVIRLNEPLVKYRQHSSNVIGARSRGLKRFSWLYSFPKRIFMLYLQAKSFAPEINFFYFLLKKIRINFIVNKI